MIPLDMSLVDVALGRVPPEVIVVDGRLVNVFTGEVLTGGLAIRGGRIAAVGDIERLRGPDTGVVDADGAYLIPGLVDGHQHVEDSRMSITTFSDAVVPVGTTSIYTGFDHIAVTAGLPGIRAFLDEAEGLPLKVFWGAPFRLPYTDPSSAVGFPFTAADHAIAQRWPECVGIWELTPDFLADGDPDTIEALRLAKQNRLGIYGAVPWAAERMGLVQAHAAAGLRVDHEAYTPEEVIEKLRLGLRILIRDSPVEHFLPELIGAVLDRPDLAHLVGFCTDQANAAYVARHGHIDRLVREAVAAGVPPITAVQMGTVNTARIYGLEDEIGSLTPGRWGDVLFVEDLDDLRVDRVMARGAMVATCGRMDRPAGSVERPGFLLGPFDRGPVEAGDFLIPVPPLATKATVLTMVLTENAFVREGREITLPVSNGTVPADPESDVLLVGYVGRFARIARPPAVAFVSGFGLKEGAIASSCTPDDDNILVVGTSADDMVIAVNTLIAIGGGDIAVAAGDVRAVVPLPVGGIVSDLPLAELRSAQEHLDAVVASMGCQQPNPFMYLGVLCITGIPYYGISDQGLIDATTHQGADPIVSVDYG